jgi:UDP-glucuronate 4-epimerase
MIDTPRCTQIAKRQDWSDLAATAASSAAGARSLLECRRRDAGRPDPTGDRVLVTGGAGFIGSHLARRLLADGLAVTAVDDFNDYYDPALKWENVADLLEHPGFEIVEADLRDIDGLRAAVEPHLPHRIVHLAARAGVRPSLRDPQLYITVNVLGTQNVLDLAREWGVRHMVYASSSSVYGGSTEVVFRETQSVDAPISPYAASKKANELQATCYNRLYRLPVTGLRFFTVYGPGGRPDMAIRMFMERMDRGEPVPMFGDGSFDRDYTYIDDIVDGVRKALDAGVDRPDHDEVFNLGESDTTNVRQLILMIAAALDCLDMGVRDVKSLDVDAQMQLIAELEGRGLVERRPLQPGDVPRTCADVSKARRMLGYAPSTPIVEGILRTVAWHREKRATTPPAVQEGIRTYCRLRHRTFPDSLGRTMPPAWTPDDAVTAAGALDALTEAASASDGVLAARVSQGLGTLLSNLAEALASSRDAAALAEWRTTD